MSIRLINWFLVLISIFGLGIGVLAEPGSFGISCYQNASFCWNTLVSIEGEPFLTVSASLFLVSSILLFFRREIFIAWAKFGAPAFVVMLAVIYYTYNNAPASGGWVNWGSDEQLATGILPVLFFIISIIIISVKSYQLRSGSSAPVQH